MAQLKAQELRVGNYVGILFEGIETQVTAEHIKLIADGDTTYKPIPLTEEWHNKFGVTKNGFGYFEYQLQSGVINFDLVVIFAGDYVYLRQGERTIEADVVTIWNKDLTKRDMHVHEWQNLFHSLTGNELTINHTQK